MNNLSSHISYTSYFTKRPLSSVLVNDALVRWRHTQLPLTLHASLWLHKWHVVNNTQSRTTINKPARLYIYTPNVTHVLDHIVIIGVGIGALVQWFRSTSWSVWTDMPGIQPPTFRTSFMFNSSFLFIYVIVVNVYILFHAHGYLPRTIYINTRGHTTRLAKNNTKSIHIIYIYKTFTGRRPNTDWPASAASLWRRLLPAHWP